MLRIPLDERFSRLNRMREQYVTEHRLTLGPPRGPLWCPLGVTIFVLTMLFLTAIAIYYFVARDRESDTFDLKRLLQQYLQNT